MTGPISPQAPPAWAEVNGVSLRYRVDGSGPPVVLVHEMGGSIESWDPISSELARTNTVIRYDQRCAGLSEKPTEPFTVQDLAADLAELLKAVGTDRAVHLVGAAAGAPQVLLYAADHPEAVASVTLLAPATNVSEAAREVLETRGRRAAAEGMRPILQLSLDRAWPRSRRADAAFFEEYRGRYLANDPRAFAQHNAALARMELSDTVNRVRCPSLVVAGRHDLVRLPEQLRSLADELPSASFAVIDSAHFMAPEAPVQVLERISTFHARTAPGSGARHADIPEEELTPEQRTAVAEAERGTRGSVPAPMRAWLASPEFARRAQSLGETLRYHTSLPARLSELAILVTARFWRSDYEWRVHAPAAAGAGLAPHLIESIRRGSAPLDMAEDERLVFDVSLTLHRDHGISGELFDRATAVLGREGTAELIGILGYYTLVSMTLNTYQIDTADADGSPFTRAPAAEEDSHAR